MGTYFSLSNLQCDVKSLIGADIELSLRGQIQICRRCTCVGGGAYFELVLVYLCTCLSLSWYLCTCVGGGAQFELVGIRSCRLPPTWSSDPRRTFFNLSIQGFPIHALSHNLRFIETFTKDLRPFWIPLEYLEILLLPTPALTSQRNNPLTKKH